MHRTQGDGFILDPIGLFPIFADEDPPTRDATQLRHQEANAWQEEICNVILAEGIALNAGNETIQQMTQLNQAIDAKDTALQTQIDNLDTDDITNNSTLPGTTLSDVLNDLDSDDVGNGSILVAGASVSDALDALKTSINTLTGNNIINDSLVAGSKVKDALNTLNTKIAEGSVIQSSLRYNVPLVNYLAMSSSNGDLQRGIQVNSAYLLFRIPATGKVFYKELQIIKKVLNTARTGYEAFVAGNGTDKGCVAGSPTLSYGDWIHLWAAFAEGKTVDVLGTASLVNPADAQTAYALAYSVASANEVGLIYLGSVQVVEDPGTDYRLRPFDQRNSACYWRETRTTAVQVIDAVSPGENLDFDLQYDAVGDNRHYGRCAPSLFANCLWMGLIDFEIGLSSTTGADITFQQIFDNLPRNPYRVTLFRSTSEIQASKNYLNFENLYVDSNNTIKAYVASASDPVDVHTHCTGFKVERWGLIGITGN